MFPLYPFLPLPTSSSFLTAKILSASTFISSPLPGSTCIAWRFRFGGYSSGMYQNPPLHPSLLFGSDLMSYAPAVPLSTSLALFRARMFYATVNDRHLSSRAWSLITRHEE